MIRACLVAGLLAAACNGWAAAPNLNGEVALRPLTPQEKKDYSLSTLQGASGLSTVGIGQPVYLEALLNTAIAPSNIVGVTWVLTNKPIGSAASLGVSPLGTNVPTYKMADRASLRVASRTVLVPDVAGQYEVFARIEAVGTPAFTNITKTITAGSYVGVGSCVLCHSGSDILEDTYTPWSQTRHATFFTRAIDGQVSDHYGANCISCHTVGFDANTNAINGGFDDVAKDLGWTFPAHPTNGAWAAMPAKLQNVSNIQCENCHGPGSEHAIAAVLQQSPASKISVNLSAGDCAQCHDSKPNHVRNIEWNNSGHAVAPRISGANRIACIRCHTAYGFTDYIAHLGNTAKYATNTVYEAVSCGACHDPHDVTNPHQLRTGNSITLDNGTLVTDAGNGAVCMNCHQSRTGNYTNSIVNWPLGKPTWQGGSSFGPHDNPAADILMGANGVTYGREIPSSAHRSAVEGACVGCHMQSLASTDPGWTKAGGHTMKLSYDVVSSGVTNTVELVGVCNECHGEVESFNMVKADYNSDGVIEGVQTEVQRLLDRLSALTPGAAWRADGNYEADGVVKTRMNTKTNWQVKFLNASWNWQLVNNDLSKGVHNTHYTVGLLKASIADLTGDGDMDGLTDSWEIAMFGAINKYGANDDPDKDGVKNSLEASAGTSPNAADTDGDGISDLAELQGGSDPMNAADKPGFVLQMFGAAELQFYAETGKTYQLQKCTDFSAWANWGDPIAGANAMVSRLTSLREGEKAYFRVKAQ
jgi:hypothetical protein